MNRFDFRSYKTFINTRSMYRNYSSSIQLSNILIMYSCSVHLLVAIYYCFIKCIALKNYLRVAICIQNVLMFFYAHHISIILVLFIIYIFSVSFHVMLSIILNWIETDDLDVYYLLYVYWLLVCLCVRVFVFVCDQLHSNWSTVRH